MVHQRINFQSLQHTFTVGFFILLRGFTSILLGFLASRCYLFENFSPFSLILLAVSADLKLIPTFCYLSSAIGYLSYHFDLTTVKYIIALTMIFIIYTVFRKSMNLIHGDSVIITGICCFSAGLLCMLIDRIELFEILLLVSESTLVSCCIFFVNYASKAFRRSCFLTAKEIIAAVITLILLLLLLHDIYLFQMNAARITAIFIFLLALYCLKISHAALLGSCLGILLAGIGSGGDAIFTATVVGGFAACVLSDFSQHLSPIIFVVIYDIILLFFGKFPWNYPMFAEPLIAYAASSVLPKEKIRSILSRYIAVRTKEKRMKTNQKIIDACQKECSIICPKAQICYDENRDELKDVLESLTEKYCNTEEFGNIEDSISFCIKPHAMAHIIKNRLIFTHSEDFEDLIEQLDHISRKMKQKFDIINREIQFLTEAEDDIRKNLLSHGISVKDINFIEDEHGKRRCDLSYLPVDEENDETAIKNALAHHFKVGMTISFEHESGEYSAHAKEKNTFKISCAALCKSKSGEQICGDHAVGFSNGKSNYYLMLSDGMGSGKTASVQSEMIIDMLRRLIESGLSIPNAMNVYHSASRLHREGYFTTIDICSIDLNKATAEFYKAGAFDSYHISGDQIAVISGGGLPVGLSEREKLSHQSKKLLSGDFIVMVSDGIGSLGDRIDVHIAKAIDENVRIFARNILKELSIVESGSIDDDVTVLVCKIQNSDE